MLDQELQPPVTQNRCVTGFLRVCDPARRGGSVLLCPGGEERNAGEAPYAVFL
jgi:hypothetical protein